MCTLEAFRVTCVENLGSVPADSFIISSEIRTQFSAAGPDSPRF
jgi:hypothetical protein